MSGSGIGATVGIALEDSQTNERSSVEHYSEYVLAARPGVAYEGLAVAVQERHGVVVQADARHLTVAFRSPQGEWGADITVIAAILFMIVEHFRDGDPAPVYRRFREEGRLVPAGLEYLGSWVTADLTRCYQVMECDDRALLDEWMAAWDELVHFEVIEIVTSAEAAEAVARQS